MGALLTLGEVLVEVMRPVPDLPLDRPGPLAGPFASGAPAIFACAAARLGAESRMIGRIGRDPFGDLCLRRFETDGVDTRHLSRSDRRGTGIAFVSYRSDGTREFVFHLRHAASAELDADLVDDTLFDGVAWVHLNGSTLAIAPAVARAGLALLEGAWERGIRISFDPNLRPELLDGGRPDWLDRALALCDVALPSGGELSGLIGPTDPREAAFDLLERGVREVVHKLGERGSTLTTREGRHHLDALPVEAIDPTGAGDAFAAAYATLRLEGATPLDALAYANVVGALATTRLGPMEGLPNRLEVQSHLGSLPTPTPSGGAT